MSALGRRLLALLAGIGGFFGAFLIGFYASLLFDANIHDVLPSVAGLTFAICGGVWSFLAVNRVRSR